VPGRTICASTENRAISCPSCRPITWPTAADAASTPATRDRPRARRTPRRLVRALQRRPAVPARPRRHRTARRRSARTRSSSCAISITCSRAALPAGRPPTRAQVGTTRFDWQRVRDAATIGEGRARWAQRHRGRCRDIRPSPATPAPARALVQLLAPLAAAPVVRGTGASRCSAATRCHQSCVHRSLRHSCSVSEQIPCTTGPSLAATRHHRPPLLQPACLCGSPSKRAADIVAAEARHSILSTNILARRCARRRGPESRTCSHSAP